MVVNRKYSSEFEEGFAINPQKVADNSFVNMYLHHDGYPEWQGVQLANWIRANNNMLGDSSRLAAKLVHDMYYDSCYLYPEPDQMDHQYTYIVWTGKKDIWISCWDQYENRNIFVLKPEKIISKYMQDMKYTDFANKETRLGTSNSETVKYHAERLIEELRNFTN